MKKVAKEIKKWNKKASKQGILLARQFVETINKSLIGTKYMAVLNETTLEVSLIGGENA